MCTREPLDEALEMGGTIKLHPESLHFILINLSVFGNNP